MSEKPQITSYVLFRSERILWIVIFQSTSPVMMAILRDDEIEVFALLVA